jgi:hypothetical protein
MYDGTYNNNYYYYVRKLNDENVQLNKPYCDGRKLEQGI